VTARSQTLPLLLASATILGLLVADVADVNARISDAFHLQLPLGKRASATCRVGDDLVSARIDVSNADLGLLERIGHLALVGPYQVRFRPELGNRVVGIADRMHGVTRCEVSRTAGKLNVRIGTPDPRDWIAKLQRSVMDPEPWNGSVYRSSDRAVRKLLRRKEFDRALALLKTLGTQSQLRSYSLVRIADTQLLAGRIPTAHAHYKTVRVENALAGLRMLADARAAELAFIVDKVQPSKRLLWSLRPTGDPWSEVAQLRVAGLLLRSDRIDEGLRLLRSARTPAAKTLRGQMLLALFRRLLWTKDPYRAAVAHLRHAKEISRHPAPAELQDETAELLLLAAEAYHDLDLPADAARLLHRSLSHASQPFDRERILPLLASAYADDEQWYRAEQTCNFYLGRFSGAPREADVYELRAGLRLRQGDRQGGEQDLAHLAPERADRVRAAHSAGTRQPVQWQQEATATLERLQRVQQQLIAAKRVEAR